MARKKREPGEPVIIKKYANRRLYNTETSGYVTLDHLASMIQSGQDFVVRDAKTGEDLTRSVLTQIIYERETRDSKMLPLSFLRQLISFYGDSLQSMVPGYLQSAMDVLTRHQDDLRRTFESGSESGNFMPLFEEIARQNLALFEQSLELFTRGGTAKAKADHADKDQELSELKSELAALKKKVDSLSG